MGIEPKFILAAPGVALSSGPLSPWSVEPSIIARCRAVPGGNTSQRLAVRPYGLLERTQPNLYRFSITYLSRGRGLNQVTRG